MEIINEVHQKDDGKEKQKFVHRNLAEVQRCKLEKLMKNPEKPVIIPESSKSLQKEYVAPSFVRNVMGSSAGAGSGEFHVYRHLRRKEFARQKNLKIQSEQERLDEEFQQKLEQNQMRADEKTNKKRAKRLKQKMKAKAKGKKQKLEPKQDESDNENSSQNESENNEEENESTPVSSKENSNEKEQTPECK